MSLETDGEHNKWLYWAINRLSHVIDADTTISFTGHQEETLPIGGKRIVETGTIYDLHELRRLRKYGLNSIRKDMVDLGDEELADHLIFSKDWEHEGKPFK